MHGVVGWLSMLTDVPFVMTWSCLFQVGCGAGNTVFPVLELNPDLQVYCCDFSPRAVELVRAHPKYASGLIHALGGSGLS